MEPLGLIAAMSQESNALLHQVKEPKRLQSEPVPVYALTISGIPCVLITSGMGIRRAGKAARLLIEKHTPQLLISFGIAGAVEADLEIGDVVLVEGYRRVDRQMPEEWIPLATWPDPARRAIEQALIQYGSHVFIGTAITTSRSQVSIDQLGPTKHAVLEMETSGIAEVANEKGLPLLSLRSISDGPRSPIPLDLAKVMDEDANLQPGKLLNELFHKPGILLQGIRTLRNTASAADRAANALIAALNHWMD